MGFMGVLGCDSTNNCHRHTAAQTAISREQQQPFRVLVEAPYGHSARWECGGGLEVAQEQLLAAATQSLLVCHKLRQYTVGLEEQRVLLWTRSRSGRGRRGGRRHPRVWRVVLASFERHNLHLNFCRFLAEH